MRFHVRGIDHLRICGSSVPGKVPEQVLPNPALGPTHKAIINRGRRTILGRAIAPPAAALEHVHDTADHAAIVFPLHPTHICRQVRLDPAPLLLAQPKQVLAHDPDPLQKTNQDRIVTTQELMSFDPNVLLTAKAGGVIGPCCPKQVFRHGASPGIMAVLGFSVLGWLQPSSSGSMDATW